MDGALATGGEEPLEFAGILQAAMRQYRTRALTLWTIAAAVVIPVQLLTGILYYVSLPSDVVAHHGRLYTATVETTTPAGIVIAILVLSIIAGPFAIGALSRSLIDAYSGHATDWRASLRFAASRFTPLLWLSILTGLLVAVGFVLIIPGVYLLVAWSVAVYALMFEGKAGFGALDRSHKLVKDRWWATFLPLLFGFVLVVALRFGLPALMNAIESGLHDNSVGLTVLLDGIATALAGILTYPVLAAIAAVIYVDLRARKEGFSVHELSIGADDLTAAARPEASSAP